MVKPKQFEFGDKVLVPWGRGWIAGIVLEVYGPRGRLSAFVRVPTRGPLGETLEESDISFPLDTLKAVANNESEARSRVPTQRTLRPHARNDVESPE